MVRPAAASSARTTRIRFMSTGALVRYNFRVLVFNNWWLVVFPLAASQLSVFWYIITQKFTPALPAQCAEIVSPLLAAFLSAHVLTAEYQSRIGAIVASKPVNIGKVVLMRLAVVMGLVWFLGLLSLLAFYYGMSPYDIPTTAIAGFASTIFLAMVALIFATLLRNPLAGFGIAALYWALDLAPGPPIHALFSLRALTISLAEGDPLSGGPIIPWWCSKIILVAAAIVLYRIHSRMIFTLGTSLTVRVRRRALAWAAGTMALYIITGASIKVAYGFMNLGSLQPDDGAWFRRQFSSFGPIPVSHLFGPAFPMYIGEIPNAWRIDEGEADRWGDTVHHRHELREIVDKMPDSIWAPGAAELLSRLEARKMKTVEEIIPLYDRITIKYANSPYVPFALRMKARTYADAEQLEPARKAYEALIQKYPQTLYQAEALHFLVDSDRRLKNLPGAADLARKWTAIAHVEDKFTAYLTLAEILSERSDKEGAKEAAKGVATAVREFRAAKVSGRLQGSPGQIVKWDREANEAEVKAKKLSQ